MKEEDFLSLLNEIEAMSIEEYNEYHKEAQKQIEKSKKTMEEKQKKSLKNNSFLL